MRNLTIIILAGVLALANVLPVQTQESERPSETIARLAGEMTVEELSAYLDTKLQSGEINLGDVQGAIQGLFGGEDQASKERLHELTSAALVNLKPEYIRALNTAWYPKQADDEARIKQTSDFIHAFIYSCNGHALLDLGRADEAVESYKAVTRYTEKNYFGLYTFPVLGKLAQALNASGRYKEALNAISIAYAVDGSPWMDSVFEEAYRGAGLEPTKMDDYIGELRQKHTPEMLPITVVDFEGNEVSYGDMSGGVTLIITWFPRCAGCDLEMPVLQELYDKYKDRGLSIVAIKVFGETEEAKNYRKEKYGFATFPFFENLPDDDEREVFKRSLSCRGNGTYLIDRNNRIVLMWGGYGAHLNDPLRRRVTEALGVTADTDQALNP